MVSWSRDAAVVITPELLIANAVPVLPELITHVEGVSPVADTVITVAPDEASSATEPDSYTHLPLPTSDLV